MSHPPAGAGVVVPTGGSAMPTVLGSMRRLLMAPTLADVTFARAGLPRPRHGGHPPAGGDSPVGHLRIRVGHRRARPVGGRAAARAGRPGAARLRLRGRHDGLHHPRRDGRPGAAPHPGPAARARRAAHLPRLHRHRVRDGPPAAATVAEGRARPQRLPVPPDDDLAGRRRLRVRPRLLRHPTGGSTSRAAGGVPVAGRARLLPAGHRPGHRPGAVVHPRRPHRRRGRGRAGLRRRPARPTCGAGSGWPPPSPAAPTPRRSPRCAPAAGPCAPELAQGAVFAAKARSHAGYVPAHSEAAMHALGGPVRGRRRGARRRRGGPRGGPPGRLPAYEVWRRNVRAHFEPAGVGHGR